MLWSDIHDAFANVTDLLGQSLSVVTANPGLMAIFVGGLMGVGFRIFKRAKRAVR